MSLQFGDRIMLNDFSYDFNKGDKIGIVGANGVGKSTFIKVISGQQPIDSGEIELGETIVIGVYDQMGLVVEKDQTVLEFVMDKVNAREGATVLEGPDEARNLLKQFEFQRERWNDRISMLSGGERRRLQLLAVLTKRPNFLIMDEPSNVSTPKMGCHNIRNNHLTRINRRTLTSTPWLHLKIIWMNLRECLLL